jgi:hypothetical protein
MIIVDDRLLIAIPSGVVEEGGTQRKIERPQERRRQSLLYLERLGTVWFGCVMSSSIRRKKSVNGREEKD